MRQDKTGWNLEAAPAMNKTRQAAGNHHLAQALFKLRLTLKALVAVTAEDVAIAHPSGVPISRTSFHADALSKVREASLPLVGAALNQLPDCFRWVGADGVCELVSALRAIRKCLERAGAYLRTPPFTNDDRMVVGRLCEEARDLCGMAIRAFAIRHIGTNQS
jgi:hypothetical protein